MLQENTDIISCNLTLMARGLTSKVDPALYEQKYLFWP